MSALSRSRSTRQPASTSTIDFGQSQQPLHDSRTGVSPSRLPRAGAGAGGGGGGLARTDSVTATNSTTSAATSRTTANATNATTTATAAAKPIVRSRPLSGSSTSALARSNSVRSGSTTASATAGVTREAPLDRTRPPVTTRGRRNVRPTPISVLPSAAMNPLSAGPSSATAAAAPTAIFSSVNAASFASNGDLQQQQQQQQQQKQQGKHVRAKSSGLTPLSLNLTSATTLRAPGNGRPKSPTSASVSTESSATSTTANSRVGQRSARSSAIALVGKEKGRPPSGGKGIVDATKRTAGPSAAAAAATAATPTTPTTSTSMKRRQTTSSLAASSSVPGRSVTGATSAKRMSPTAMDPAKQSTSSLLSAVSSTDRTASAAATAVPSQAARLRPAFTTLQQHYSPARSLAPKPTTASILAPPSPSKLPANVALSAETSRLQADLLQLHALHRAAAPVDAQWRDSARRKLAARFRDAGRRADEASREEAEAWERKNVLALSAWASTSPSSSGGGGGGMTLEKKVQTLDVVLSGLWALDEQQQQPDMRTTVTTAGKYARVVRRFERWAERASDLAERRRRLLCPHGQDRDDLLAMGEQEAEELLAPVLLLSEGAGGGPALDDAWRDECAALTRRLDEWRVRLAELGDVPGEGEEDAAPEPAPAGEEEKDEDEDEGDSVVGSDGGDEKKWNKKVPPDYSPRKTAPSSLATILRSCRSLVADMLAELDTMAQMEREAAEQETEWVRAMIGLGDEEEEEEEEENKEGHCHDDEDDGGRKRVRDNRPRAGAIWRAF